MKIMVNAIPRDPKECPYSAISVRKNEEVWYICRWHNIVAGQKGEMLCNCDRWKGCCKYFKEHRP